MIFPRKIVENTDEWTFGIPTDGKHNLSFHSKIIRSIVNQEIPSFEIIFCVEKGVTLPELYHTPPCRVIHSETKRQAWITRKKNLIVNAAKFRNICLMHDYIYLDRQWYQFYKNFDPDWDVCMNPVIQKNKKRFFDWVSLDHPRFGFCGLMPYEITNCTKHMYVSGSYFCVKKRFMIKNPLNEGLVWGQGEDNEWSRRVRSFWKLKFNRHSPVYCLKNK